MFNKLQQKFCINHLGSFDLFKSQPGGSQAKHPEQKRATRQDLKLGCSCKSAFPRMVLYNGLISSQKNASKRLVKQILLERLEKYFFQNQERAYGQEHPYYLER